MEMTLHSSRAEGPVFSMSTQSNPTQRRPAVPLWRIRQVPTAGVGAKSAESSGSQRGDGHAPSLGLAGVVQPQGPRRGAPD